MALPDAIKTVNVTFGPGTSTLGTDLEIDVAFSAPVAVVWAATGTPLINLIETERAEAGETGAAVLPNPAQDGFIDGDGNPIRDWTYRATAKYKRDGLKVAGPFTKTFALSETDTDVHLDKLIPVPTSNGVVVAIPDTWTQAVSDAQAAAAEAAASAATAVKPAELDAKTAALISTDGTATKTKLSTAIDAGISAQHVTDISTFSSVNAARPGSRIAYLGDSITAGAWQNSSHFQGGSFPLYAMLQSGGRLLTAANAGKSGDTSAQALARFDTEVTPAAPTAVVVLLGTNDTSGSVTLAEYGSNITTIVAKTRAIGAVPVLCTIPPNDSSLRHPKINLWNAWLRRFASTNGLALIDFYKLLADPANGNYSATYVTDGTHPNTAGYVALGKLVSDTLSPLAPAWGPYMSQDNTDNINALTATNSVMLTDANADGVPDGWFAYGGSTGYAHALVTDTAVSGKMAQITQTANASLRSMQKSVSGVSVGDVIAISGVVTSNGGVESQVKTTFTGAGSSAVAADFTAAITHGVFYQELTVPAATTGVTVDLLALAGTGVVAYGQVTVLNLTTNQLL